MLIVLLFALAAGLLAPAGYVLRRAWLAIPRSNADFEWLDL